MTDMDHRHAMTTRAAERYLLKELADADRDAFEAHYFSCAHCAADVRAGALMQDGVRADMAAPAAAGTRSKVLPIGSRRRWHTAALPWAVAASMTVIAGYQALWVVPELRRPIAIEATTPVLLRPASRGTLTTVSRPEAGVVAFALDITVADRASSLTYDFRTADGTSVASGVAAAPPVGTPLLLVVPAARLSAPGDYLIMMRDNSPAGRPLAEYRFAVAKP
jgi:anti-sigma factor RsiW